MEIRDGEPFDGALELPSRIDAAIEAYDLRAATGAILEVVGETNRDLERTEPWKLRGEDRASVLAPARHATDAILDELEPLLPALAARATARLQGRDGLVLQRLER